MLNGRKFFRGANPLDLLNPEIGRVSEEVQKQRMDICQACPLLHKITKMCAECGCFMHAKTKLPNAFCPKGKWAESVKSS
jgi:hypothetical protein